MTSACLSARPGPVVPVGTDRAFSEEGGQLTRVVVTALDMLRTSRTGGAGVQARRRALEELAVECAQSNWDGYGAAPINPLSEQWAARLLDALPSTGPTPELTCTPQGDVLLEWFSSRGATLAVSVGRAGEIRFALRAPGAKLTGIEAFADEIPPGLADALATLVR